MRDPRGDRPQKPAPRNATEAVQRIDEIETQIDELRKGIGYLFPQRVSEQKPADNNAIIWDAAKGMYIPQSLAFGPDAPGNWKVFYSNGSGAVTELSLGADNTVLTSTGASAAPEWATVSGMKKAQGTGYYTLPAAPGVGANVTPGNGSFGSYAESRSASGNAIYIVGARFQMDSGETTTTSYFDLSIATGAASSETQIAQWSFSGRDPGTDSGMYGASLAFPFPLAVAASTRIAVRAAASDAAVSARITLIVIDQADLVDL